VFGVRSVATLSGKQFHGMMSTELKRYVFIGLCNALKESDSSLVLRDSTTFLVYLCRNRRAIFRAIFCPEKKSRNERLG
jgi:hypothetical protein